MMLSSACSNRLLPLLHQALHRCKEEEKQLEEQIRKWRTLLDNWDAENGDPIKQDEEASEPQEIDFRRKETVDNKYKKITTVPVPGSIMVQPSAEDMQEVELLNKALEKALRVRGTSKMDPPVHKPSIPAPTTCPVTKENPIKALNKLAQKGTRPASYQLHPPYKTIPDRRRIHRPGQRATSSKSIRSTPPEPPAPKKCNTGEGGQLEMKTNTTQPSSTLDKPVSPPSRTSGPDISPPQKPSTLKEKGATLKLPVEYQQMYMKSSRLWEKFYAIRDHLPASRPSFIQKLQTTFAPEAPGFSLSELEEATHRLQREVRTRQQQVDGARNRQGSGPERWQKYRCLLLLETLQGEVAKYQSELQGLQLVAEEYRNWAEKLSINASCPESFGCPSMYSGCAPVLVYSHPGELRELSHSRLRALELQQKIHLQKVFTEELLAEAESWSRSAPTSCLPLRAIYTQLCEGGRRVPGAGAGRGLIRSQRAAMTSPMLKVYNQPIVNV